MLLSSLDGIKCIIDAFVRVGKIHELYDVAIEAIPIMNQEGNNGDNNNRST